MFILLGGKGGENRSSGDKEKERGRETRSNESLTCSSLHPSPQAHVPLLDKISHLLNPERRQKKGEKEKSLWEREQANRRRWKGSARGKRLKLAKETESGKNPTTCLRF